MASTVNRTPVVSNPVLEYHEMINVRNEIPACQKLKRTYQYLVDVMNDANSEFMYSEKHAQHILDFMQNHCRQSKGRWAGKPIELMLWQKAMLCAVFGFIHKETKLRMIREVLAVVARKGGKSTVSSGVGNYLLSADGEAGGEIVAVATTQSQARIVWEEAKQMVLKSPALRKRIKVRRSDMVFLPNNSVFKPISSESNNSDGANINGAVLDEIHAWKDHNLYDVIRDAVLNRTQPLIFMITTAGTVRESTYDIKYDEATRIIQGYDDGSYVDPTFISFIYELDDENEVFDEAMWEKSNPSLDVIKDREELRNLVNKARANKRLLANLLCKHFNMKQGSSKGWLTYGTYNNEEVFDLDSYVASLPLKTKLWAIGGYDLSQTTDLTSACIQLLIDGKFVYKHMYWLPADLMEERISEDKIPYDIWLEQGYLRISEGGMVDTEDVLAWFKEVAKEYNLNFFKIGYDVAMAKYLVDDINGYFGEVSEVVRQGKLTLSAPMESMAVLFKRKQIVYQNNPITKWCIGNTNVDEDKRNGMIQPVKNRRTARIDGFAAMLNAYTVYYNSKTEFDELVQRFERKIAKLKGGE